MIKAIILAVFFVGSIAYAGEYDEVFAQDVPVGKRTIIKGAIVCRDMFVMIDTIKRMKAGDIDSATAYAKKNRCGMMNEARTVLVIESNATFNYAEIEIDGETFFSHPFYIDAGK
jgi:hypothetical protein